MTINVDGATPVGHYAIGVFVTDPTDGMSSDPNFFDLSVCDGVTGQCPDTTPTPGPSSSPCATGGGGGGVHDVRRAVQSRRAVRSSDCPGSTPDPGATPAPPPPPPPPPVSKALYTASLGAHASIPMTDAAQAGYGSLTWAAGGDLANFTTAAFAATATGAPPHANSFAFDVPATTPPGDYTLHFRVTSSVTSASSGDATVTLRVLSPAFAISTDNPLGIFELDQSENLIVSDGGASQTSGDGTPPDFPYAPGVTASAVRRAASTTVQFDPSRPPQAFVNTIVAQTSKGFATCGALLVTDNAAHDPSSGNARGAFAFYGYCAPKQLLLQSPRITYGFDALHLNSQNTLASSGLTSLGCIGTGQTFGPYGICATSSTDARSLSGQAELQRFKYSVTLGVAAATSGTQGTEGTYIVNSKGTFYPKVAVDPAWGTVEQSRYDGLYYVPFYTQSTKLIQYCPPNNPPAGCSNSSNNSRKLGSELRKAGFPKPGPRFEAHHIQPTSWGGDDSAGNGIWLDQTPHGRFTTWWGLSNFQV